MFSCTLGCVLSVCSVQLSKTEGFDKLADNHPHIMAELFAHLRLHTYQEHIHIRSILVGLLCRMIGHKRPCTYQYAEYAHVHISRYDRPCTYQYAEYVHVHISRYDRPCTYQYADIIQEICEE